MIFGQPPQQPGQPPIAPTGQPPMQPTPPLDPEKEAEMKAIAGGIKNALEKGSSLEQAKASFINGGYDANSVNAAIAFLTNAPIQMPPQQPGQPQMQPPVQPQMQPPFSPQPSLPYTPVTQAQIDYPPQQQRQILPIQQMQQFPQQNQMLPGTVNPMIEKKPKKSWFKKNQSPINSGSPEARKALLKRQKSLPLVGQKEKAVPKWMIYLLIILGIILILAAGFLGVFWNQLNGPF